MQENAPVQKVLVAVDHSEQSLRAIRYAARMFSPDRTQIVLFHVQIQVFNLPSDLEPYPYYQLQMSELQKWAAELKEDLYNIRESSLVYFKERGFPSSSITLKARLPLSESSKTL